MRIEMPAEHGQTRDSKDKAITHQESRRLPEPSSCNPLVHFTAGPLPVTHKKSVWASWRLTRTAGEVAEKRPEPDRLE